jgi:geranylgeranyl diphosphate synthase type I
MDVHGLAGRYVPAIDAEMKDVLRSPRSEVGDLYGYLHYHMGWVDSDGFRPVNNGRAGKRLRPVFCLLSCEACGGDWQQALPTAAALELLHNFSLVHDDIEDGDHYRRGKATLWTLWGLSQAVNAGDSLYALAHMALIRLEERGVPPGVCLAAWRLFESACLHLTEGQFLDMQFEERDQVSAAEYLHMVSGKTAALFAASCQMGSLIGGASQFRQGRLRAFGHHLGLAFQMQDDILGIWGDPKVTGKPVGSDLRAHKKTLPVIYARQHDASLRAVLDKPVLADEDVAAAVEQMERMECHAWAREQEHVEVSQSMKALESAALQGEAADALRQLALHLVRRDS